jgi:hypothetical protein
VTYLQPNAFLSGGNTVPPERRVVHIDGLDIGTTVTVDVDGGRDHFRATEYSVAQGARLLRVCVFVTERLAAETADDLVGVVERHCLTVQSNNNHHSEKVAG